MSGLAPNLQRNVAPPRAPHPPHHEEPEAELDEYEAAEQGIAYPNQPSRMQKQGPRGRSGPPKEDSAKPNIPPTWLERNRNLVIVSIGVLIILVIMLIWYQFSRQPAQVVLPVRGAGQARQQGAPPERPEAETPPEEPSEAVDESTEGPVTPAEEPAAAKPKPPAAKAPAAKKKPAAPKATERAEKKRDRVHGDPIRTADDKEISEFANMDTTGTESSAQAETAEEVDAD